MVVVRKVDRLIFNSLASIIANAVDVDNKAKAASPTEQNSGRESKILQRCGAIEDVKENDEGWRVARQSIE